MANKYNWVDDPCISGKSPCDTDVLNENLMHIKYDVTDEIKKKADDAINEVANAVAVQRIYDCGISTDTKGFEIISRLAHSTFDESKFEVVGSPNITNDGIASGFTGTDYLTVNTSGMFNNNYNFEIATKVKYSSDTTLEQEIWNFSWIFRCRIQYLNNKHRLDFMMPLGSNYVATYANLEDYGFVDGDDLYVRCVSENASSRKLMFSKDGKTWYTITNTSTTDKDLTIYDLLKIGQYSSTVMWLDSNDLKQFSITVDGIPIFSGNKTGIDVIKPDNYEVVGTPTISDDGIASGFSSSNYLTDILQKNISNENEIIVEGEFNTTTTTTTNVIFTFGDSYANRLILFVEGVSQKLVFAIGESNTTRVRSEVIESNTNYKYKCVLSNNKLQLFYKKVGETDYTATSQAEADTFLNNILKIGVTFDNSTPFIGTIDLNAFKVYVDGSLIYQPCLKIPYTETFEHPKVVDVAYRDRVQDLYEQTGEALFYTLDEQNQDFTLPAGDIYGMITKNREILDIVYPIGRPMPEENNVLLDNEVWLEGATVNIVDYPKLFKIYGTKYGGDGITTLKLPDMRNRVLWGSSDGSNGYIEAKLPNIKGGSVLHSRDADGALNGCFYTTRSSISGNAQFPSNGRSYAAFGAGINANLSNEIYSDDATTVQPPAFKVRWKTRFE